MLNEQNSWLAIGGGAYPLQHIATYKSYSWRRGVVVSGVRRMNEVSARRARLVLGWVTAFGRVCHLSM